MTRSVSFAAPCAVLAAFSFAFSAAAAPPAVTLDTPLPPPYWALLQRELLRANAEACLEFFDKYFDERGYLLCVERWGGDDGPDDAIENCNDWPILHALGAPDEILEAYKRAWEGHLRQYTEAKTVDVPFARDGMYYKEFPVMFDWLHNGEGLTVFNLQGLSDPQNRPFQQRVRRYAGFYMNEDSGAANYDAEHKMIRSMFNGSRGPLMRKATALDWAGDPIEVKHRFDLGHGEESYEQMLQHFKDYNDIDGDHPQNLLATSLALNAYMLSGEEKYKAWLVEYVDAWRDRMAANDGIIPTNIGPGGVIGGSAGGKWYGGVYGWGFSVEVPQDGSTAHRNLHHLGFTGFINAFLLTGDDAYLQPWRKQMDLINAQVKEVDGVKMYPTMHGDQGWYNYKPEKYSHNALELYYLSMRPDDRQRVGENAWLDFLDGSDGRNTRYAFQALTDDFARIRERVEGMRNDPTTPDARLADDPMKFNPASVNSLIQLMLGGIHPKHQGSVLHCRLRYFDPENRRAGIPLDVGAIVEELTADSVTVALVNINQSESRDVVVQGGAYAEHQFINAVGVGQQARINNSHFTVRLAPGCGGHLRIAMQRYANHPTLTFPWDRN